MAAKKDENRRTKDSVAPVRAVSRAIRILQIINRRGNPTIMEIKEESGLAYPTVFRMVLTLQHEGLIESEPSRKRYRPTELVWSLVTGFQEQDQIVPRARAYLQELTSEVLWPIALSVRVGDRMMVKDSTHAMTTQTFTNYYPGYTLPIFDCAAGKAYISFCPDEEREMIFKSISNEKSDDLKLAAMITQDRQFTDKVRSQGFATHARNVHTDMGKTSSIGLPIMVEQDVKACLALTFFDRAMSMEQAVTDYIAPLRRAVENITKALEKR